MKLSSACLWASGLLLCAATACNKNPGPTPASGVITKISAVDPSGDSSTTVIAYQPDGSINYTDITDAQGNVSHVTYTYLANLTVINYTDQKSPAAPYQVDSIMYGSNGLATYSSRRIAATHNYDMTYEYFYNSAGQLATTIFSFPSMGQIDTIHHVWHNGDLVSQSSTLGTMDQTYAFDLSKPAETGDLLYMGSLLSTGKVQGGNAHLVTAFILDPTDSAVFTYQRDGNNRIVGYSGVQGKYHSSGVYQYQ
jgi:hypothetical protein